MSSKKGPIIQESAALRRNRAKVEKQKKFLRMLAEHGTVRKAARCTPVGVRMVYTWAQGEAFQAQMLQARELFIQKVEGTMFEKAVAGDTLAGIFVLKAMRPAMYRDKPPDKIDEEKLNGELAAALAELVSQGKAKAIGDIADRTPSLVDASAPPPAGLPQP